MTAARVKPQAPRQLARPRPEPSRRRDGPRATSDAQPANEGVSIPKLQPDAARALCGLAEVFYQHGLRAKAKTVLEGVIALCPDYADAHLAVGVVLDRDEDTAGARRAFQRYRELRPRCFKADVEWAQSLIEGGEPKPALRLLEQALAKARSLGDSNAATAIQAMMRLVGMRAPV